MRVTTAEPPQLDVVEDGASGNARRKTKTAGIRGMRLPDGARHDASERAPPRVAPHRICQNVAMGQSGWSHVVRITRLFARALALRCPRCGRAPALQSWFVVRPYCEACRLRLDRGERGYFIGAGCLNLVITELLFAFGLFATILLTLPNPPWNAMIFCGIPVMVGAPILFFPLSRTLWIALDLTFRPRERRDDWTGEEEPP
ncbi:MAG TPA: DUF983 domain-containing protein [Candidatus Methylomirabilis sp.]|nr:DUF983 domain-containing protein [Candidatus Methylomirabilis sp.]